MMVTLEHGGATMRIVEDPGASPGWRGRHMVTGIDTRLQAKAQTLLGVRGLYQLKYCVIPLVISKLVIVMKSIKAR